MKLIKIKFINVILELLGLTCLAFCAVVTLINVGIVNSSKINLPIYSIPLFFLGYLIFNYLKIKLNRKEEEKQYKNDLKI